MNLQNIAARLKISKAVSYLLMRFILSDNEKIYQGHSDRFNHMH